jgi:hypothetical protein
VTAEDQNVEGLNMIEYNSNVFTVCTIDIALLQ